ncbi:MAG TPA: hypothetical protein VMV10_18560 [Pirellulales bacterium]|nr:hypothetical protein [Pirellulales bacterium]
MRRLRLELWRKSLIWACLLAVSLGGGGVVEAQAPNPETAQAVSLAALVPSDVGLCIETDRLAEHVARFMNGPLFERLAHFPPLTHWVGQNGAKIGMAQSEFHKRLGASPAEVWAGILGGRALFAVWPPAGDSTDGPALLLVEAKDRRLLKRVLDNLVALQRDAGKLKKTSTLEHAGLRCEVHWLASGENRDQLYLTTLDNLAIVANDEGLIRDALSLSASAEGPRGALASLPGYAAGSQRLSSQTAVRLFVNPRPWDAGLLADLKRKPPESQDARFQKAMIETWQATDYIVAGLELGSQATLESFAAWRTSDLPPAVREAAESVSGGAAFAERIPRHALAAVAGRIDWGRLVWRFALPRRAAANAVDEPGAEIVPGISGDWLLPAALAHGIGPDFGAYLVPRPDEASREHESRLPMDLVAGLQTRPLEPGDGRPSLAKLAEPVVHSLLTSATAATNAQAAQPAASLETIDLGGIAMTSVAGLPGPRGRPLAATYAVVGDDFWVASSPAALRRAVELPAADSLAAAATFDRVKNPSHLFYVDLKGVRQLLASSPGIVEFLAASKGLDRDAARRSFRELLAIGELADAVSVAARLDETGVAASLSIAAQSPLAAETRAGAD